MIYIYIHVPAIQAKIFFRKEGYVVIFKYGIGGDGWVCGGGMVYATATVTVVRAARARMIDFIVLVWVCGWMRR
jgi:dihydrodipicolinate synthase/N-acetylneuraminate lyase